MDDIGQIYLSGSWQVKKGSEAAFIKAWQQFANWTVEKQAGARKAVLLQDREHADRFLSFGPWESEARIAEWRSQPEFAAFVQTARELCEEIQPRTMVVVASAG
ncbi:MAG TPA: antibiotic biosynthesis monooxygenase family protein [Anaerolineales bacterium]|nr:antibiotic biosynthesis monooxygenase family protein [Anaerolineales bacterium]